MDHAANWPLNPSREGLSRNDSVEQAYWVRLAGSCLQGGNCMAVGQGREFGQDFVPPASMGLARHRQFERGLASRPAPHRRPAKQPPAQRVQFAFFQLPQAPLEWHSQVVGGDGQMRYRLGAPEVLYAQPLDAKLLAQFFDAIFDVRPTIVLAPNRKCVHACKRRLKSAASSLWICMVSCGAFKNLKRSGRRSWSCA